MAEGKIIRLGGGRPVVIDGQEVIAAEYQQNINKFDTVIATTVLNPTRLSNPDVLPGVNIVDSSSQASFGLDDIYLAVASISFPYFYIYKRSGDAFNKLSNPASLPNDSVSSLQFSPDATYLIVASTNVDFRVYKRSGDSFSSIAAPTPPNGIVDSIRFSPDGTYMAVGHSGAPRLSIYKRSGDTFTLLATPNIIPSSEVNDISFSSDGLYLAAASFGGLLIYKRSGDIFTKLADPDVQVSNCRGVDFSPDTNYISVSLFSAPFNAHYKRQGDAFIKLDDVVITTGLGVGQGVKYSKDNTHVVIGLSQDPTFLVMLKRIGDRFVVVNFPDTFDNATRKLDFSATGSYLAIPRVRSPYVQIYKTDTFYTGIFTASNVLTQDVDSLGYALENGITEETKTIMSLFRTEE